MPTSADFAQQQLDVFKKWAKIGLFPVYFRPFLITTSTIQIENSLDGVIGIRTRGRRKRYHGAMAATVGCLHFNFKTSQRHIQTRADYET